MPVRLEAVRFGVADAAAAAAFWAELLGRALVVEDGALLLPGDETQVGLRFVGSTAPRRGRPRLHLHLTSTDPSDQQQTVATVLRLGGRHLDVGQAGDEGFVVLADPQGTELCVIEPGNRYLAGTGRLGEVICEGSRAVGLFWRDALDWPLVWDEGEQTAVQSPRGGTKLAWDVGEGSPGEPREPREPRDPPGRQRFDLTTTDLTTAVERLVGLGATLRGEHLDHAELVDPDGTPFGLRLT